LVGGERERERERKREKRFACLGLDLPPQLRNRTGPPNQTKKKKRKELSEEKPADNGGHGTRRKLKAAKEVSMGWKVPTEDRIGDWWQDLVPR